MRTGATAQTHALHAEKWEPIQSGGVNDGLQICPVAFERKSRPGHDRKPTTPGVIANERVLLREQCQQGCQRLANPSRDVRPMLETPHERGSRCRMWYGQCGRRRGCRKNAYADLVGHSVSEICPFAERQLLAAAWQWQLQRRQLSNKA
jgi:hypothetical protein